MTDARSEFRSMFEAEYPFVCGVLRRAGVRHADVEDAAHEVFLVLLRRIKDYDRSKPLRPWLVGIAVRVAADQRRLARHTRELLTDAADDNAAPSTIARFDRQLDRKRAWQILEPLPDERRAVYVLHELLGFSMPEVAEQLGIPLNTGYTRLRLARADLAARGLDLSISAQGANAADRTGQTRARPPSGGPKSR